MNTVIFIGRLTSDPVISEVKAKGDLTKVASFVLAVPKGKDDADFFRCNAWGKLGENLGKYCKKGSKICISGCIHNREYTKTDGSKGTSTEVMLTGADFISYANQGGEKKEAPKKEEPEQPLLPFDTDVPML